MSCSSQKDLGLLSNYDKIFEPGKCYLSVMMEDETSIAKKENAFVLEIEEEEFKQVEKTYTLEEVKRFKNGKNTYTIPTKPYSHKYIFRNDQLIEFVSIANSKGFMICMVEIPREFKTITEKDFIKNKVKISSYELIKSASLKKRYVKRKPKRLSQNQLFFPKGNWSELREAISPTICFQNTIVKDIKIKLVSLGYDLEINNIIDEKTKAALTDFQQKNGLKTGQLDSKTMKALGVEY